MSISFLKLEHPCSEKWERMHPNGKGRFCDTCSKQVIDFTKMNMMEISEIMQSQKSVCARLSAAQLKEPIFIAHKIQERKPLPLLKVAAGLMLAGSLVACENDTQNVSLHPTEQMDNGHLNHGNGSEDSVETHLKKPKEFTISGFIKIADSLEPVFHARVTFITIERKYETFTSNNGYFSMNVPDSLIDDANAFGFTYTNIRDDISDPLVSKMVVINRLALEKPLNIIADIEHAIFGVVQFDCDLISNEKLPQEINDKTKAPIVFENGKQIDYSDFFNALIYNKKTVSCNMENKWFEFYEPEFATAILGSAAPNGLYLIKPKS